MREPPPAQLASLLERLGLASIRDLENVQSVVHRMSGDLPQFESVWIDALRKARILTHFQAAELHAGRGEALKIAHYVLCQSVQECGYATVYRAEDCETREAVRLAVFSPPSQDHDLLLPSLEILISSGKGLPRSTGKIEACGLDDSRHWAASPWVEGISLADSLLHHGRFPPPVVLEIARAMLGELATLEAVSVVHGDIRVQNVLIANNGEVHTPHPGLRGIIRPHEGISHHDLLPDACSGLAPERVTDGTLPTVASDFFACGCVWWHMLCGQPPLGGGDSLARLRGPGGFHRRLAAVGGRRSRCAGRGHPRLFADRPAKAAQVDGRTGPAARPLAPPRSPGDRPLPGRRSAASRSLAAIEANSREKEVASASIHGGRPRDPGRRGRGLAPVGCTQSTAGESGNCQSSRIAGCKIAGGAHY